MGEIRVLIVEDEAIIAFELTMILERAGYVVTHVAYTAEAAIKNAEADRPDVIIMDVLLRGSEDGIHIAERINSKFNVPILFITGNSRLVSDMNFKNINRYVIMSKPPLEDEIIRNVHMLAEG